MNNEKAASDEKKNNSEASVLILSRLLAPSTRLLYSNNINADVKGK